MQNGLAEDNKD